MARIKLLKPMQPVADFSVAGSLITIAGLIIDCAAYYAANERMIEVRSGENGAAVIGGTGAFLAVIAIPKKQEVEGENGLELVPLDPNTISITLWPTA